MLEINCLEGHLWLCKTIYMWYCNWFKDFIFRFFGVITDHKINTPGNGNNVVYDINATDINDLKEQMKFFGYLKTNDISNIGINPCASKSCSINFSEQCLHILNYEAGINGLKAFFFLNQEYWSKYDPLFYTFKLTMMLIKEEWNQYGATKCPPLYIINGKTTLHVSKCILIYYHYRVEPNICPGVFYIRNIHCSCQSLSKRTIYSMGSKN